MANGVLVFIEQREGKIRKASLEALSEGARLAAASGRQLSAALIGHGVDDVAAILGRHGASRVFNVDSADLAVYSGDGYAAALAACCQQADADLVLVAGTALGRDLAPRVGARIDAAVVSDVVEFRWEEERFRFVRPAYSGKVRAIVETVNCTATIATLRPNVFPLGESETSAEVVPVTDPAVEIRDRVTEIAVPEGGELDVAEADIICSGGRGIQGPENWPVIRDLCDALGGALGASRAAVDAGWIGHAHQVGQTGKVVSPSLYIASGISGAIQHLAGMNSSKFIVAINKDPEAPIFKVATYGVVGDLFEVVPALASEIRELKAE